MNEKLIPPTIVSEEVSLDSFDNEKSENLANISLVYHCNMRTDFIKIAWKYAGGNWQNENHPIGQTCNYPTYDQCKRERKFVQGGTIPCGAPIECTTLWRYLPTGEEVESTHTPNPGCGKNIIFYTLP